MSHSISPDPEPGVHDYYKLCTTPERFSQQMYWLRELGYFGVNLAHGLAWLDNIETSEIKHLLESGLKPVAITFDDGFEDNYTCAFPVLKQHKFSATIYIPTSYIGDSETRHTFRGRPCITWNEARAMQDYGIEFGSHTARHPVLTKLSDQEVLAEIEESKARILARLGTEARTFAYPFAFPEANRHFTQRLLNHLQLNGFTSCVTTSVGVAKRNSNRYTTPRLPVNSRDDRVLFQWKLLGAYTWLGTIQSILKNTRSLLERKQSAN